MKKPRDRWIDERRHEFGLQSVYDYPVEGTTHVREVIEGDGSIRVTREMVGQALWESYSNGRNKSVVDFVWHELKRLAEGK